MAAFQDLSGQRFDRLTVSSLATEKGGRTRWVVLCDCGTIRKVYACDLRSGHTQSCGCKLREVTTARNKDGATHGHSNRNSATYRTWTAMKQRCYNTGNNRWKYYGQLGVGVCQRWNESFEAFLADMGERPTGKTLDRFPDKDGDYMPGNCRWASVTEQNRNRRPFAPRKAKADDV